MTLSVEKIAALLDRKGISATVQIYPSATFDPTTNKTVLGSVVEYTVKVIPPYRIVEGYRRAELITSGKGMTGIANKDLNFEVKAGLILVIDGKTWTVISRTPLSNKDGVLAYLMEIESGH